MTEIRSRIIEEIKSIEDDIDAQKRTIKHNARNNSPVVHAAEQNLKQLHTRLDVLRSNLEKCDPLQQA